MIFVSHEKVWSRQRSELNDIIIILRERDNGVDVTWKGINL
jgi:hypothetical protein